MPREIPSSERDPAHREVSQETKDEFLMLVDELSEKGYKFKSAHGRDWRAQSYPLGDGRMMNITFDTYSPERAIGKDQKVAAVIIAAPFEDGNDRMMLHTVYQLFRDGTFEKIVEEREKPQYLDMDTPPPVVQKKIATLYGKVLSIMASRSEAREMGIIRATEAEAREAIEILKHIQDQEESKKSK